MFSVHSLARVAACALLGITVAGCPERQEPAKPLGAEALAWRADCPPIVRPAPLSLDAAREAYRAAEARHELRLREAANPGAFMRSVKSGTGTGFPQPYSSPTAQAAVASLPANGISAANPAPGFCLSELAETGQLLFDHEYGYADGLGSGDAARSEKGPFRRVHEGLFGGPETISCPSCHWVGGPNGAGAETDNVFLSGDGLAPDSGDTRNSPALVALGVVEALAREMTADLQAQRAALAKESAREGTAREQRLVSKGVDFGVLRATADGSIDASGLDGVDDDLVVKPFGWKGTRPDITGFVTEALQAHIGIQTDDLLAEGVEAAGSGDASDPDGDGLRDEFGSRALAALTAHLALLELPIVEPLVQDRNLEPAAQGLRAPTTTSFVEDFARGREQFHALGCASCHRPMMVLENPVIEIAGLPPIDLSRTMRRPALQYDEQLKGYPVWLFSDLKRHRMGRANVALHRQRAVARNQYLTPRLWGVADSAPYLHDGRAPSFDYAIAGHDGEGRAARRAFAALGFEEKGALRVYLMSLRRAPRVMVP
ncbi:MAG: di-heme oxidoredictase family protein [Candidatus Binatia bacterium]